MHGSSQGAHGADLNDALVALPLVDANLHCQLHEARRPSAWIVAVAISLALAGCGGSDETAIRVVARYNQSRAFDQFVFALATGGKTLGLPAGREAPLMPRPPRPCPAPRAWCS